MTDLTTFSRIADSAAESPEGFKAALEDATAELLAEMRAGKAERPQRDHLRRDRDGIGSWIGR